MHPRARAAALLAALLLLSSSLVSAQAGLPRDARARALSEAGFAHDRAGRLDSAAVYFSRALEAARAARSPREEARARFGAAVLELKRGQPAEALAGLAQALELARAAGDRAQQAAALNRMGLIHQFLGRPDSAQAALSSALALARAEGLREDEGRALMGLGYLHAGLGRADSALARYAESLEAFRAAGSRTLEGTVLMAVGNVHGVLGRPDSSRAYYERALRIQEEAGNRLQQGVVRSSLASARYHAGEFAAMLDEARQALAIYREVGYRAEEGSVLMGIGVAFQNLGQLDSARVYLSEALPLAEEKGDRQTVGSLRVNLTSLELQAGRPARALEEGRHALEVFRAMEHPEGQVNALMGMADAQARMEGAEGMARAAAYADTAASILAARALHAGGDAAQVSLAEANVRLYGGWARAWLGRAEQVGERAAAVASLAAAERGRAQGLLSLLRASASGVPARIGSAPAEPWADLLAEGEALVDAVRRAGTAAVSYAITADELLAWLVLPDGTVETFRRPIAADSLAARVGELRAALGADDAPAPGALPGDSAAARPALERAPAGSRGIRVDAAACTAETDARSPAGRRCRARVDSAAAHLAELLLSAELRARLPRRGGLAIAAGGVLGLVPFAALPAGRRGEPLGARLALRYVPSLTTLAELEGRTAAGARPDASTALVVGNPAMPSVPDAYTGVRRGLAPLPAAEREGRAVAAALGVAPLLGADATEAAVRARIASAGIVHLATHGYAYADEARVRESFVALAAGEGTDGLLTLAEVLDELPPLSADLVVLSACRTGLGDLRQAEGTVGFQRALLARGAGSVLVSLWSVSDEATERLMASFYRHWLRDRDRPGKAEALRRAQEELRRTPGFESPLHWAAFQLVGGR